MADAWDCNPDLPDHSSGRVAVESRGILAVPSEEADGHVGPGPGHLPPKFGINFWWLPLQISQKTYPFLYGGYGSPGTEGRVRLRLKYHWR